MAKNLKKGQKSADNPEWQIVVRAMWNPTDTIGYALDSVDAIQDMFCVISWRCQWFLLGKNNQPSQNSRLVFASGDDPDDIILRAKAMSYSDDPLSARPILNLSGSDWTAIKTLLKYGTNQRDFLYQYAGVFLNPGTDEWELVANHYYTNAEVRTSDEHLEVDLVLSPNNNKIVGVCDATCYPGEGDGRNQIQWGIMSQGFAPPSGVSGHAATSFGIFLPFVWFDWYGLFTDKLRLVHDFGIEAPTVDAHLIDDWSTDVSVYRMYDPLGRPTWGTDHFQVAGVANTAIMSQKFEMPQGGEPLPVWLPWPFQNFTPKTIHLERTLDVNEQIGEVEEQGQEEGADAANADWNNALFQVRHPQARAKWVGKVKDLLIPVDKKYPDEKQSQ